MGADETRRKVAFALAVAALAAGALAMAIFDGEEGTGSTAAMTTRMGQGRLLSERNGSAHRRGTETRSAAFSARRFVRAYLLYQEGNLSGSDRTSLLRYSTPDLGGQLVRAPVRIPPGSRAPRQFVARIAAVQAGLFDGSPAFIVTVVVAGSSGTHLLNTSLVEHGGIWVVAGIGP